MVVVCRYVSDQPKDYTDSDEFGTNPGESDTFMKDIREDYEKAQCIPVGLSAGELKTFWELTAKWEKQIRISFLTEKLFVVLSETNDGRSIKVNFGSIVGWCNDTKRPHPRIVVNNIRPALGPAGKNTEDTCHEVTPVSKWVGPEISGTNLLRKLANRFPIVLEKLENYAKRNCCPYEAIRGRIEIVNDGIDFLQALQGSDSDMKPKYSGPINSDFANLKDRLDNLILITDKNAGTNYSTGKCCPGVMDKIKNLENSFGNIANSSKPDFDWGALKARQQGVDQSYADHLQMFHNLEGFNANQSNNNDCCGNQNTSIYELQKGMKDFNSLHGLENLEKFLNPLNEILNQTNVTLSSSENLNSTEMQILDKLSLLCDKCTHAPIRSRTQMLTTKIDALNTKYDKINFLQGVNWANLNESINEVNLRVKEIPKIIANLEKGEQIRLRTSLDAHIAAADSMNRVDNCLQEISKVRDTIEDAERSHSKSLFIYKLSSSDLKNRPQEFNESLTSLEDSILKFNITPQRKILNPMETEMDQLENELKTILNVDLNDLAKEIQDRKKQIDNENERLQKLLDDSFDKIKLQMEEAKMEEDEMENRLTRLEGEMKLKPSDDADQINQLTHSFLRVQKKKTNNSTLNRIEQLQKQLNSLNENIAKATEDADECHYECDFGELPSIDRLMERIQVLKKKLTK
ncbi:hypothetical protein KR018_000334, partial [Drosophila ironensis]